eukprot:1139245-Pelagomonas_calceolata.AAC.6
MKHCLQIRLLHHLHNAIHNTYMQHCLQNKAAALKSQHHLQHANIKARTCLPPEAPPPTASSRCHGRQEARPLSKQPAAAAHPRVRQGQAGRQRQPLHAFACHCWRCCGRRCCCCRFPAPHPVLRSEAAGWYVVAQGWVGEVGGCQVGCVLLGLPHAAVCSPCLLDADGRGFVAGAGLNWWKPLGCPHLILQDHL